MSHIKAYIGDNELYCLLDSGCDRCILPQRLVSPTDLRSDSTKLFAADGSEVDVAGSVTVDVLIGSRILPTTFLVSSKVNGVILGLEFMCNNNCEWRFADRQVRIAGEMVSLCQRPVVYLGRMFVSDSRT